MQPEFSLMIYSTQLIIRKRSASLLQDRFFCLFFLFLICFAGVASAQRGIDSFNVIRLPHPKRKPLPIDPTLYTRSLPILKTSEAEILFQNSQTGAVRFLLLTEGTQTAQGEIAPTAAPYGPQWHVFGTADLDHNGTRDLLVWNTASGQIAYWLLEGPDYLDSGMLRFPFVRHGLPLFPVVFPQPLGAMDLTDDHIPDILFRYPDSGGLFCWPLLGTRVLGNAEVTTPLPLRPEMRVVGFADVDGDDSEDILLQNDTTGALFYWLVKNGAVTEQSALDPAAPDSPDWKAVGVADIRGDTHLDILFQSASRGDLMYWEMEGVHRIAQDTPVPAAGLGPEWQVVAVVGGKPYTLLGLGFGPFVDGQDPNYGSVVSDAQIQQRMRLVAPFTHWIRTFGCTLGQQNSGRVAHSLKLKAAIGAWLSNDLNANETEITNLITAAQAGEVDLAIVGSETLLRGDLTEEQLLSYLQRVRQAVPGIPVTTADGWASLMEHPNVLAACDVIMANIYPYWEGLPVVQAMAALHNHYRDLVLVAGGKPVYISETGWPSAGNTVGQAIPSPETAQFYFQDFISWARANQVTYFCFEAFDESWKANHGEGPQGAHFGIWDQAGVLKTGMETVFWGKALPDDWTGVLLEGPGTPTLAFTEVPSYGATNAVLRGTAKHIVPSAYRIAVYIKVGAGWWTKPTYAQPLTSLGLDGSWSCNINTGGNDPQATEIAAFLLPYGFLPTRASGNVSVPSDVQTQAVAAVHVTRSP